MRDVYKTSSVSSFRCYRCSILLYRYIASRANIGKLTMKTAEISLYNCARSSVVIIKIEIKILQRNLIISIKYLNQRKCFCHSSYTIYICVRNFFTFGTGSIYIYVAILAHNLSVRVPTACQQTTSFKS